MGYRIPGVVNTDAHYNFHGSGGLRNYIKSATDEPAKIDTMEMVRQSEAGHITMTNGPFLEVTARAVAGERSTAANSSPPQGEAGSKANDTETRPPNLKPETSNLKPKESIPGDEFAAPGGKIELSIRVQCANWYDINRVQVFLNGRPEKSLNFTRRENPERFAKETVRFEATLPISLKDDTHIIVAAAGEGLEMGRVLGPTWGKRIPIAVANPIFVDVDGGGFRPNGDRLGVALPIEESFRHDHKHPHGH
jgi:hypothetical protein